MQNIRSRMHYIRFTFKYASHEICQVSDQQNPAGAVSFATTRLLTDAVETVQDEVEQHNTTLNHMVMERSV